MAALNYDLYDPSFNIRGRIRILEVCRYSSLVLILLTNNRSDNFFGSFLRKKSTKENIIFAVMISAIANTVFQLAIEHYHRYDDIDHPIENPYDNQSLEHLLYLKCWIDTAQWHMEDVVRNPEIAPQEGLYWKRRIDKQNQVRTDMVEYIDSYYLQQFGHVQAKEDARINTESPAWAIDR